MQVISRQRGVSLIEVLIAVLIFSLGLVGMAGLLLASTRSNQAAYLRTQVAFLASNMANRMRANPTGVWHGTYNVTFPNTTTATCNDTTGCTPDQLAQHDIQVWNSQLATFLPTPQAKINCDATNAGFTPSSDQQSMGAPYGGTCNLVIQWTERGAGDTNNSNAATQTFSWNFQP
jgi:type IV pilus assembly protein PilV